MEVIHTKEIQDILYCYYRWEQNRKKHAINNDKLSRSLRISDDLKESKGKSLSEMAQIFGIDNPYRHIRSFLGLISIIAWLVLHYVVLQLIFLSIFEESHPVLFTICYIALLRWTFQHDFFKNNIFGPNYLKIFLERKEKEYLVPKIEAYHEKLNDQLNKGELFRVLSLNKENRIVLYDDEIRYTKSFHTCTVQMDRQTEMLPYYVVKAHDYNAVRLAAQMLILNEYYPDYEKSSLIKYKNHEKPTTIFLDDKMYHKIFDVISVITGVKGMDRESPTAFRCLHCPLRNQCNHVNSEVKNSLEQRA